MKHAWNFENENQRKYESKTIYGCLKWLNTAQKLSSEFVRLLSHWFLDESWLPLLNNWTIISPLHFHYFINIEHRKCLWPNKSELLRKLGAAEMQ